MPATPLISDDQRRARVIARHHLGRTAPGVLDVIRGVAGMHSSDPATPYLGCWARVPDFTTGDLDRELLETRTLWRLHAMRRTLFVVLASDAPVFFGAVGHEFARQERRRVLAWLGAEMDAEAVPGWLASMQEHVLSALADGRERRTQDLCAGVPELTMQVTLGQGKWTARVPIASRLLFLMAFEALIVRTRAAGTWRSSQYHWALAERWFGGPLATLDPEAARAELARRYLATHGPATLADLRWWTGWTAKYATAAVRALQAVAVELEDGREAFVLPSDTDRVEPASHVALLPGLDPTPMGWQGRAWYLGPHKETLFDRNGNIGPSIWMDGRIVGGWAQRPGGEVVYRLLEDVGREATVRIAEEAALLTSWAGGLVADPRFPTPLERELSGPKSSSSE